MAKKKVVAEPEVIAPVDESIDVFEEVLPEELLEPEEMLFTKIMKDNIGAPVFAIIRDVLKDIDPAVFDEVLQDWIRKDLYVVFPPYTNIRDGYVTELGKLYARNTYGL